MIQERRIGLPFARYGVFILASVLLDEDAVRFQFGERRFCCVTRSRFWATFTVLPAEIVASYGRQ